MNTSEQKEEEEKEKGWQTLRTELQRSNAHSHLNPTEFIQLVHEQWESASPELKQYYSSSNSNADPLGPSPPMDAYYPSPTASSLHLDQDESSDVDNSRMKWDEDGTMMQAMSQSTGEPHEAALSPDTMDGKPTREQ